jgi:DNA-directed RNA polymerase subunit RPC12/RpoP
MTVIEKDGKKYEAKRIYECYFCGKERVAGPDPDGWMKFGVWDPTGRESGTTGHVCPDCTNRIPPEGDQ